MFVHLKRIINQRPQIGIGIFAPIMNALIDQSLRGLQFWPKGDAFIDGNNKLKCAIKAV